MKNYKEDLTEIFKTLDVDVHDQLLLKVSFVSKRPLSYETTSPPIEGSAKEKRGTYDAIVREMATLTERQLALVLKNMGGNEALRCEVFFLKDGVKVHTAGVVQFTIPDAIIDNLDAILCKKCHNFEHPNFFRPSGVEYYTHVPREELESVCITCRNKTLIPMITAEQAADTYRKNRTESLERGYYKDVIDHISDVISKRSEYGRSTCFECKTLAGLCEAGVFDHLIVVDHLKSNGFHVETNGDTGFVINVSW